MFLIVFTNDFVLCAGYLIVGFAHAKCFLYNTSAQWFGPDVTCKRTIIIIIIILMIILMTNLMTFIVSSGSSSP